MNSPIKSAVSSVIDFGRNDIRVCLVDESGVKLDALVPPDFPVSALLLILEEGAFLTVSNDRSAPCFIGLCRQGRLRNVSHLRTMKVRSLQDLIA